MATGTYGSATYNGVTSSRISMLLKAAQSSSIRNTALKVSVLDTQINRWSLFTGTSINPYGIAGTATYTDQNYRGYRVGMSMCILTGGKIVRMRVGDGTAANRNIYFQEITSPTTASQWTTWTLLYTGAHFAVAVVPATATTYHVYTAKSDGIYKNNVKKQSLTLVMAISPVVGQADAMFVTRVRGDTLDSKRVMDHYYSPNIETTGFSDDTVNYRWMRSELAALKLADSRIARVQVAGFYINPRSTDLAESLTISFGASYTAVDPVGPPVIIRGFAGQAGSNSISNIHLNKMVDGFYYLFYSEVRYDADKTEALSTNQTLFWQRSIDLLHWSEPVAIGYADMNPTGITVVESGGTAYLANNGAVYTRPLATTTYDLSNYVTQLELETPKANQGGSGQFPVANPAEVNNALLDLTDCEVKVEIGLRCADGTYAYTEFGRWWIDKVKAVIAGKTSRLQVTLYDLWRRLDNPLRDNFNNVGKVIWRDWEGGGVNQLFNYYPKGGTYKTPVDRQWKYVAVTSVTTKNFFLFTAVKSHNADVEVRFRTVPTAAKKLGLVYRYIDDKNYYWAYSNGATLYLVRVRNGISKTLTTHSKSITSWFTIAVDYRWGIHRVYIAGVLEFTYNEAESGDKPGYAGVRGIGGNYNFYHFSFTDWMPAVTTNDLITTLLAMGDFHNPAVAGGEAQQLAIVWGPQTDLNTPAKALIALCDQFKLELAWRDNRIVIGQFKEKTIIGTFNNEVIAFARTEEVGRRINLASVDGREDSWIELDGPDTRFRGRQIVAYFDVPELTTDDTVRLRAQEEIRKGVIGSAYAATLPLQFDLWRMDGITIVDNSGTSTNLKVEGYRIEVDQSMEPVQHMELELSPLT